MDLLKEPPLMDPLKEAPYGSLKGSPFLDPKQGTPMQAGRLPFPWLTVLRGPRILRIAAPGFRLGWVFFLKKV